MYVRTLELQLQQPEIRCLSVDERLGILLDAEVGKLDAIPRYLNFGYS